MTSSTLDRQSASASPIADEGDDADGANDGQEQNWLTIRRRCELCKQRKVRFSITIPSVKLACPEFRPVPNPMNFKNHGIFTACQQLIGSKLGFRLCGRRPASLYAPEPMQPSQNHSISSNRHFSSLTYLKISTLDLSASHLTSLGQM